MVEMEGLFDSNKYWVPCRARSHSAVRRFKSRSFIRVKQGSGKESSSDAREAMKTIQNRATGVWWLERSATFDQYFKKHLRKISLHPLASMEE
jgi:hypothetical protein